MTDHLVDQDVYEAVAQGLARLQVPDLSPFRRDDVGMAMMRAFTFAGPDPLWLSRLEQRIESLSDGAVTVAPATAADFPAPPKTPGTAFLRLADSSSIPPRAVLAAVGPFFPPVELAPAG
jgi:hypothetical protein